MNLKEKEILKQKVESLEELLKCVDSSFIYESTTFTVNQLTTQLQCNLISLVCIGDRLLALNLLLRMLKDTVYQLKGELNNDI